jgi:hypothetical protein
MRTVGQRLERSQLPDTSPSPSWRECRQAARAVRNSLFSRQALDAAHPQGVSGLLRSHAPLPLLLRLAPRERRLIWRSPGCFAVLEPPLKDRGRAVSGARRLRLLDQYWDVSVFITVPFALLAVAALLGWIAPSALIVALVLILAALAITCAGVVSVAVLQAYRLLSGRRRINETAVGQVRAVHWTMVLCQVDEPNQVGQLLDAARRWGSHRRAMRLILCCIWSGA